MSLSSPTYDFVVVGASSARAWGFSTVSSWCKNSTGRSTQNWPLTIFEFWQRTRQVDAADFIFTPLPTPMRAS